MTDGAVELSTAEARRIALRAQRLGRPRPTGGPTPQDLRSLVQGLGAVQLDAVNVLVRSHYLAVYSRLGPYPMATLDDLVYRRREAFEYWGHAASFLPIELYPSLRWRMVAHAENARWRAFLARVERERPGYVAAVEREVAERGPLALGELRDPARREKSQARYADSTLPWYRWSDGKTVLEGLFDAGRLAAADRRGFERRYDLAERVIPPDVLSVPAPAAPDAHRALIRHAAGALGVATVRDFADYFRLPVASTRARLRELVDGGELRPARVQGWADGAYLFPAADSAPVDGRALLYVKAPNRRYGYYVLPFLLGDMLVGRVDLKADRETRTLHVLGAFAESSAPGAKIAGELAAELRDLADWLGLDTVEVSERGDLARPLCQARPDGAPRFSPSRPRRSSAPG